MTCLSKKDRKTKRAKARLSPQGSMRGAGGWKSKDRLSPRGGMRGIGNGIY